jgi:hypothetical protein
MIRPAVMPGWSRKSPNNHRRIAFDFALRPSAVIGMYLLAPVVPLVVVNRTGRCDVSCFGSPAIAASM